MAVEPPIFSRVCSVVRYRYYRHLYGCRSKVTKVFGTDGDAYRNLPNCPVLVWNSVPVLTVPVLVSYTTYRSVRYRYWCCTGTGTGADLSTYSGAIFIENMRYFMAVTVSLIIFINILNLFKDTLWIINWQRKKEKTKNGESPWIWQKKYFLHMSNLILILIRLWASDFSQVAKTNFVCANWNTGFWRQIGREDGTHAICLLARVIQQISFWT